VSAPYRKHRFDIKYQAFFNVYNGQNKTFYLKYDKSILLELEVCINVLVLLIS